MNERTKLALELGRWSVRRSTEFYRRIDKKKVKQVNERRMREENI